MKINQFVECSRFLLATLCNIMAEGFRFHAFGFSQAENLSAQCMGYLDATLTHVFTRARRADVSLRDVTIARDGKQGLESANDVTHRKRTRKILKKSVS